MSSLSYYSLLSNPIHPFFPNPNPYPKLPSLHSHGPNYLRQRRRPNLSVTFSTPPTGGRNVIPDAPADRRKYPKVPPDLVRTLAASAVLFLGLGFRAFSAAAASTRIPPATVDCETVIQQNTIQGINLSIYLSALVIDSYICLHLYYILSASRKFLVCTLGLYINREQRVFGMYPKLLNYVSRVLN